MDRETLVQIIKQLSQTDVTKTVHRTAYPAISPSLPTLSQAGRTVVITGGGTGVGLAIALNFIRASADTVIIVGRREDVLAAAASRLKQEVRTVGTSSTIIARTCDITKLDEIGTFWNDLKAQNITVDVLVNNAAKFTEPKPLLALGADEVWSQIEANVKAPLYFNERFCAQSVGRQQFIVNVTSAVIHTATHPVVAQRPAYSLSKATGTLYSQLLAQELPAAKVQITNFHPGIIYNDTWKTMGFEPGEMFDDDDLPGSLAVWLASTEAAFLHGRYLWASWDVNELATGEIRKRILEDPYFLKVTVAGLNGQFLA